MKMEMPYRNTILSAAVALVLAPTAFLAGQPTLTADNFPRPLLGEEVTLNQYEAQSPADLGDIVTMAGENQTWDLSGAEFSEALTSTFRYQEPPFDDLPGGTAFASLDPPPNFAYVTMDIVDPEQYPDPVEVAFYSNVDENRVLNLGFAAMLDVDEDGTPEEVLIGYVPPEVEIEFPTNFGDSWTNDMEQVFTAPGVGQFRSDITRVNEVAGWGDLITPTGAVEVLQIMQESTISTFGVGTTVTNIQFLAPFQEVSGKSAALVSLQANASIASDGTVLSVSYSTIELEGGESPTAVEDAAELPVGFEIHQNFPNPFNPSTMIEYSLDQTGEVLMTVHDMLGREVAVVVDQVVSAGRHNVRWEAGDLPSGLYHVRMTMDGQVRGRPLVLQK